METVTSLCKDALKLIREYMLKVRTSEEISALLLHINNTIRIIRRAIINRIHEDSPSENQLSLESSLSYLKCYRLKLKNVKKHLTIKSGQGVSNKTVSNRRSNILWEEVSSCFNGRIRTGFITNVSFKDPLLFLKKTYKSFACKIKAALKKSLLKVNVTLSANFIKPQNGEVDLKTFATKNVPIDQTTNLKRWHDEHIVSKLMKKMEEFAEKDSGWALNEILGLKVNINTYDPLKFGASTFRHIPKFIRNKHAVVNIKNDDEYCFLWAVVSALYPAEKHTDRKSSYPHFKDVLKFDGITFPITLKDIKTFEKLNDLAINLYCIEKRKVLPCCLSDYNGNLKKNPINLLMLAIETDSINRNPTLNANNEQLYHFVWIKNFSALVSRQLSSHGHKVHICEVCLNYFTTDELLQKHRNYCQLQNGYSVRLPKETEKYLYFKNFRYQQKVPFAIYADIESILEKCAEGDNNNKTQIYQKHIPFSVAYYLKCSYDESLSKFRLFRGANCIEWFINELKSIADMCNAVYCHVVPIETLSDEVKAQHEQASDCYICKKPFLGHHTKVKDHDHQTGKYRGAAHQNCNLNYKNIFTIPVVFHNLSGYDAHFIIRALSTCIKGRINLLPINKEKYISFTKHVLGTRVSFRFIDSFRFMPYSLDKLASNLESRQKSITRSYCGNEIEFNLLNRKGVFPYDYIDSWSKLNETCLPSREKFWNALSNEVITEENYHHAKDVWNTFKIETMGEYSDLYLKTDVLLLTDVFETFRETCITTYKLDPLHYYTAPGLTFDAMLKTTQIRLELLTDIDKVLFIEKGIRGGVSQCSNRYAKANNKYMKDRYNPSEPTSYLMYFDVNNLYGAAMSEYLPYEGFTWLETFNVNDILNTPDNSDVGYIVECDLDYPIDLHDAHSDLPLAPEHMVPPISKSKEKKLLLTLFPKRNYIVHYINLKLYIAYGMKLTKVHRILQFKQSRWLKEYVDLNTKLRQQSKNDFEKDFYKLMNNAIYGKCMENVRKHRDIRLVTQWDGQWGARSLIAKPNFHSALQFDDGTAIIEMRKLEVYLNKPIYVGFCILDMSKIFLYEFHYNYIKKSFPFTSKLLYTDTDSLIYHFKDANIYEHIKKDSHRFDTSEYQPNNVFGIQQKNKKVPGIMKDENNGKIMLEFVGLRSKMYAYTVEKEGDEKKLIRKSKGSTKLSLQAITLEDYKKCLFDRETFLRTQRLIRSKKHEVYSIKQNKVVLSPYDDKRIVTPSTTDTRPWGYMVGARSYKQPADIYPNTILCE